MCPASFPKFACSTKRLELGGNSSQNSSTPKQHQTGVIVNGNKINKSVPLQSRRSLQAAPQGNKSARSESCCFASEEQCDFEEMECNFEQYYWMISNELILYIICYSCNSTCKQPNSILRFQDESGFNRKKSWMCAWTCNFQILGCRMIVMCQSRSISGHICLNWLQVARWGVVAPVSNVPDGCAKESYDKKSVALGI